MVKANKLVCLAKCKEKCNPITMQETMFTYKYPTASALHHELQYTECHASINTNFHDLFKSCKEIRNH